MLLLTSLLRALFILSLVLVPGLAVACLQNAYTPDSNIGSIIGTTAIYGYNHLNQRGTKSLNGHTRLLVYDQAGNLISELDGTTGAVLAEYIWLDGTPLAYIEQDQLYHVHADHLGTPKALTNTTGTVVWKADYSPFGQADITSQGLTFNLRFPGQYYDAETGLHYNWHRYYDPAIGRYISSDPIGLAGGINTFAYALNDPIGKGDPTGGDLMDNSQQYLCNHPY